MSEIFTQEEIRNNIIKALRTVYDPEIPVNIYDLGLIYHIAINEHNDVVIQMTLTTPSCPEAQTLPGLAETYAKAVEGVNSVKVELVWDPPWTRERMSEDAKLVLGMM